MGWLWSFDHAAFRLIHHDLSRPFLDPIFLILSTTGLGYVQVPLILIALAWRVTRIFVAPLLMAFAISGLGNIVLKAIIERDRPSVLAYSQPHEAFFRNSFPSGHSSTSFGIAITLLMLLWGKESVWVGWVAVVWAALVGVSRVYRGVHWPSDVIAGVFVGLVAASASTLVFKPRPAAR